MRQEEGGAELLRRYLGSCHRMLATVPCEKVDKKRAVTHHE